MSRAVFQQGVLNVTTSIQQTCISIITFVKKDPASARENQTTTPLGMNYHLTLPDEDGFTGVAGVSHTRD